MNPTILGHHLPHPQPSGSARRPQLDGNFSDHRRADGAGTPGATPSNDREKSRRVTADHGTPSLSVSRESGAETVGGDRLFSDETTAVWERLSNECACQCDYGCASCEPEETAEWRRV